MRSLSKYGDDTRLDTSVAIGETVNTLVRRA
jgi:hypothetical protein